MRLAAVSLFRAFRARSTISASDSMDVIPSETQIMYPQSRPKGRDYQLQYAKGQRECAPRSSLARISGSTVIPNFAKFRSPKLRENKRMHEDTSRLNLRSRALECSHPSDGTLVR